MGTPNTDKDTSSGNILLSIGIRQPLYDVQHYLEGGAWEVKSCNFSITMHPSSFFCFCALIICFYMDTAPPVELRFESTFYSVVEGDVLSLSISLNSSEDSQAVRIQAIQETATGQLYLSL